MLNNLQDVLSILMRGVLGRSGRKGARRASRFLSGRGGFLTASTLISAAGVAWGIYDSVKASGASGASSASSAPSVAGAPVVVPPVPAMAGSTETLPAEMLRVVRLAVSAARADGELSPQERAIILARAQEAGVESAVEAELAVARPLAEISAGLTDAQQKQDLYILAFTIVRADETVSGAERIYLAQLAFQLGLDPPEAARLESETIAAIDAQPE